MARESLAKATAKGRLEKTPLGHVLIYCHQRGLSGALVIHLAAEHDGGAPDATLHVQGGAVVAARVDWPATKLHDALADLCAQLRGSYAFYGGRHPRDLDDHDHAGESLQGHVDARAAVAHALRGEYPQGPIDEVLHSLRGHEVALTPELELDAYGLTDDEYAWVSALHAPVPVARLLVDDGGQGLAARLLYLLRATRGLHTQPVRSDAGEGGALTSGTVPVDHPRRDDSQDGNQDSHDFEPNSEVIEVEGLPAPPGLDAELTTRWHEIQTRHRRLPHDDCFQVLDLPRTANSADARAAFGALAPRVDPAALPTALAPLRDEAAAVLQRMRGAVEVLGAPSRRLEYLSDLDAGGGTPAAPHGLSCVWEGHRHLQEAASMLAARQLDRALFHAERAVAADRRSPEALGAQAYLRFLLSQRTPMDAAAALGVLERAVRARPLAAGLHYYLGTVLKHAGYERKADDHLRHASLIPPAREARPGRGQSDARALDPERRHAHADLTRRARDTTARLFGKLA